MAWITLAEADIVTKLSGPETTALKTAALKLEQTDPLAEILTQITREIRGYVSACTDNTLGEGPTIPDELLSAAISRVRFELATRLPAPSLLDENRKEANRQAIALLQQVAACKFRLVQPESASTEVVGGTGAEVITETTRVATRSKLSGL